MIPLTNHHLWVSVVLRSHHRAPWLHDALSKSSIANRVAGHSLDGDMGGPERAALVVHFSVKKRWGKSRGFHQFMV